MLLLRKEAAERGSVSSDGVPSAQVFVRKEVPSAMMWCHLFSYLKERGSGSSVRVLICPGNYLKRGSVSSDGFHLPGNC